MGETSIDGLARRTSAKRPVVSGTRKNARVIDMTARPTKSATQPVRKKTAKAQPAPMTRHTQSARPVQKQKTTDFLDPVEMFNFDNEPTTTPDETFNKNTGADWSDLLGELSESKRSERAEQKAESRNTSSASTSLVDMMDDESEEEVPISRRRERNHRKKRHIGRYVALAVVCLLVIGGGLVYKWGDELISRLTGGRSGIMSAIGAMVSEEIPFDTDTNGRTNIMLFGTEGYNMDGETDEGVYDGAYLTDALMVISFDQETKDVALMSLPRDLKVPMACSAGKINEVFWCHNRDGDNEQAGAEALMTQVSEVLGITFQYYAHINWGSLVSIVDTLGGVTVTLDEDIADYQYTGLVMQAGVPTQINGEQALKLARARHGTTGGDFTRGNSQRKILEAVANKLVHDGIDMGSALNLLNILGDNLRSNFSTDNIKAGVHMMAGFNASSIRQVPLVDYMNNIYYVTTATINGISYVVPAEGEGNYSGIRKYVAEMFSSNPMSREQAKVAVLNGSGAFGVASAERESLTNDGVDVINIGDAELDVCTEKYCVFALRDDLPATREALERRYGVTVRSREEVPANMEVGEADFVIVIGAGSTEV